MTSLNSQTVNSIYTNKLKPVFLKVDNIDYLSFDLVNAKVLQARLKLFNYVFKPWTNSLISNQFKLLNEVHAYNLLLEQDLISSKKRNIRLAGIFGGGGILGGWVLGILIFK